MAESAELTHHVHYGGVTMKVTYAQAYRVLEAMAGARDGGNGIVVLEAVSLGFDDVATNYLLIGPGIPVHVQGPAIPEVTDLAN